MSYTKSRLCGAAMHLSKRNSRAKSFKLKGCIPSALNEVFAFTYVRELQTCAPFEFRTENSSLESGRIQKGSLCPNNDY